LETDVDTLKFVDVNSVVVAFSPLANDRPATINSTGGISMDLKHGDVTWQINGPDGNDQITVRLVATLFLISTIAYDTAQAFQECNGNPHLRVLWEKQIIEVDGTFFQMKKEQISKKRARLVGHNMVVVQNGHGSDTLIRNGVSTSYSCAAGEGNAGLKKADVQAYQANPLIEDKSVPVDATITGTRSSPSSANGHGGGKGRGGGKHKWVRGEVAKPTQQVGLCHIGPRRLFALPLSARREHPQWGELNQAASMKVPALHFQGVDMQIGNLSRARDYAEPVP